MLEFSKLIQTFSLRMTFAFIVFLETGGWIKAKRLKCWIETHQRSVDIIEKLFLNKRKIFNKYLSNVTVKSCISLATKLRFHNFVHDLHLVEVT
jgi:hypothetical protein